MKLSKIKFLCLVFIFFCFLLMFFVNAKLKDITKKGIVSLTFDDGLVEHYTAAFQDMKEKGYVGTAYLIPGWIGNFEGRELMNLSQAREMQNFGWEIGSHAINHTNLKSMSIKELKENLKLSKELLNKEGFEVSSFSYPHGKYNFWIIQYVKKFYSSARTMREGFNNFHRSYYSLRAYFVKNNIPPEKVCDLIKKAESKNKWLILGFHYIGENIKASWDYSREDFDRILDCINQTNIEVKTISEVINDEKGN